MDLQNGVDTIVFRDAGVTSVSQAVAKASASGGGVIFDLGDGDVLTAHSTTLPAIQNDTALA